MKTNASALVALASSIALLGCRDRGNAASKTNLTSANLRTLAPPIAQTLSRTEPPFEGIIQLELHQGASKAAELVTYDIKGKMIRYQTQEPAQAAPTDHAVADLASRKAFAFLDAQKAYVEVDDAARADKTKAAPVEVKKTDRTETIAGRKCQDWSITEGAEELDVCVAPDIPYFDLSARPGSHEPQPGWAAELQKDNVFPLHIVEKDKAGKVEVTATATGVTSRALDDSLFAPPSTYKKIDMSFAMKLPGIP